jgi:hypothetical protein
MKREAILALALAAGSLSLFTACEGDLSAPKAPRRANMLTPDNKSNEDAFRRENEAPNRQLPTGGGSEFPGQSKATPTDKPVITAHAGGHGNNRSGEIPTNGTSSRLWQNTYPQNTWYSGPVPALADKPGFNPTPGSTPVPNTPWVIEHSWGEGLPMQEYPHRNWPDTQANYTAANVKHNPTYYSTVQSHLNLPQNNASYASNWGSNLLEIPWFGVQTLALPVMMVIEPPLVQVTTQRLGNNPVYLGHLPAAGEVMPSPLPGLIRWDYPFLNPDGSSRTVNRDNTTQPTVTPIPPTPGLRPMFPNDPPLTAPGATQPAVIPQTP